jgi:UDP-N-acetylmuramyl tripeptide synthase
MSLYQQLKNIYHWLQAQAWRAAYGWPDRQLKLYGVTGTNGKTTTTIVLGSIF